MNSPFSIHPATRVSVKPLIGLFSESGCGKTYSSLLLARGLVGPSGKVVMIDTESKRGSLYADVLPGGYQVLDLDPPFSPSRYIQALDFAEKDGAGVVVIDSFSHEWEGEGGVLDMAGDNESKSGKPGLHNWKTPKLEHAKMVLRLLRSSIPVICCIRAKFKSRQTKNDNGKTVIIKDDFTSPIQAEDFVFEMTVHGEIMPDHSFRLTKKSHPTLGDCFPDKKPIGIEHGEKLAQWCAAAGQPAKTSQPGAVATVATLKARLWKLTMDLHAGDAQKLEQSLIDENIISDTETLASLDAKRLTQVIDKVTEFLSKRKVAA